MFILAGSVACGQEYAAPKLPAEGKFPSDKIIKITDAGAVADGATLASGAIAKAIDQVAAAGGGIVQFPAQGAATVYLTGPIRLKSNVTLQIDEGVTVKFSNDRSLYPLVKTRYESVDIMNFSPLIYAYQCENIKITGKGTLDGQGSAWWAWARGNPSTAIMRNYTNDREGKFPLDQRVFGNEHPGYRTCFIEPYECKKVVIEGVTLRQSPFWNIHPVYSEDVIVRDVTVFGDGPNTDGCDPDSCKRVLIEKCDFTTGDDCIAIKSGRDGDGIRKNATCEDITIKDCIMKGGHGAVTMGSETSAGIKHVYSENCKVDGPDSAIRLKSTRGRGGGIEDVFIKNMQVTSTKQYGITIDMMYTRTTEGPKGETTPVFKNIRIEDFTCNAAPQGIYINGLTESNVENVILKNITIKGDKGARIQYVTGLTRENVTLTPRTGEPWDIQNSKEVK
jgi:polygalacturonase